jgi:hypothetical protein
MKLHWFDLPSLYSLKFRDTSCTPPYHIRSNPYQYVSIRDKSCTLPYHIRHNPYQSVTILDIPCHVRLPIRIRGGYPPRSVSIPSQVCISRDVTNVRRTAQDTPRIRCGANKDSPGCAAVKKMVQDTAGYYEPIVNSVAAAGQ